MRKKPTVNQLARHQSFHENRNVESCPVCQDRKREDRITMEQRGKLARDVFEIFSKEFESFREDDIGNDLAYLMGAILDNTDKRDSFVDWSKNFVTPFVLTILREYFPKKHAVWKFIRL